MTFLNWKTIEKLEAKVPGTDNGYKGEVAEFDVRLGRPFAPLSLSAGGEDEERFRIENKKLDIAVEGASLKEAKQKLRELLAASDDFSGEWKLWMQVDVDGGHDLDAEIKSRYGEEHANCSIRVKFVVELTTGGSGKKQRKRHMHMPGSLPVPFTGEFPVPKSHKDLSRMQNGGAVEKRDQYNKNEVWVEATPELVETIRLLQRRLGESGAKVEAAFSKKRFHETIAAVQAGAKLLPAGLDSLGGGNQK